MREPRIDAKQATSTGNHLRYSSQAQTRQHHDLPRHARSNLFAIGPFLVIAPEKNAHDAVVSQFPRHFSPAALRPQLFSTACVNGERRIGCTDTGRRHRLDIKPVVKIFILNRITQGLRSHGAIANHRHQFVRNRERTAVKVRRQRLLDVFLGITHTLDPGPSCDNRRADQSLQINDNVILGFSQCASYSQDFTSD